jgi:hypothetical protein
LAQPPDISETFLREVDENLRRDQLRDFFKAYGNWLIVLVILFLAASGGFIWWKQHQVERSGAEVEKLSEIYKEIGSGNAAQAPQQLDELSKSGSKAVRASAMFARAALALQQNDTKLAVNTYNSIAGDNSLPRPIVMLRSCVRRRSSSTNSSRRKSLPVSSRSPSPANPGSEPPAK